MFTLFPSRHLRAIKAAYARLERYVDCGAFLWFTPRGLLDMQTFSTWFQRGVGIRLESLTWRLGAGHSAAGCGPCFRQGVLATPSKAWSYHGHADNWWIKERDPSKPSLLHIDRLVPLLLPELFPGPPPYLIWQHQHARLGPRCYSWGKDGCKTFRDLRLRHQVWDVQISFDEATHLVHGLEQRQREDGQLEVIRLVPQLEQSPPPGVFELDTLKKELDAAEYAPRPPAEQADAKLPG